jgi:hypothetical protein
VAVARNCGLLRFKGQIKSHPLTPALSPKGARGKGSRSSWFSKTEFDSISQVGAPLPSTSVSLFTFGGREQIVVLFKA